MVKGNNRAKKSQTLLVPELPSEIDIKYQIYLCERKLQQFTNATSMLESIPTRQRTAKINMALAELYKKGSLKFKHQIDLHKAICSNASNSLCTERQDQNSIACYKEVLKENPLSLNTIILLFKLGVKAAEVMNIVSSGISNIPNMEWLPTWIKAQSCLYTTETVEAVATFKKILSQPNLRDNLVLQTSLAEAFYYNGDYKKSLALFKKVYSCDPIFLRGMDVYAACLAKEQLIKDLEILANKLIPMLESGEQSPEPWIVLAYYSYLTNKKESKALYFTQKACLLSNNSVEALLLKGKIMAEAVRV